MLTPAGSDTVLLAPLELRETAPPFRLTPPTMAASPVLPPNIPGKSQFRKFIASGMSDDKTIVISTHQVRDIDKVLDHVLIMDDSRVLLDESTSNICDKLFFVESDDRELAKSALFAIPTIQGNYLILPNEKQDESELNLELLFNATLATPEEIARLFHTQK